MNIFKVSFFGHRGQNDLHRAEERLLPLLKEIIRTKPYTSFLIGRNGAFDEYAASAIKRVQKEIGKDNSDMTLVLPYPVADLEYYCDYYDSIHIPECVAGAHPKSAIMLRNRWMVEQSDLVIVNVERRTGGAFTAMKYAEKRLVQTVNLADEQWENSVYAGTVRSFR